MSKYKVINFQTRYPRAVNPHLVFAHDNLGEMPVAKGRDTSIGEKTLSAYSPAKLDKFQFMAKGRVTSIRMTRPQVRVLPVSNGETVAQLVRARKFLFPLIPELN